MELSNASALNGNNFFCRIFARRPNSLRKTSNPSVLFLKIPSRKLYAVPGRTSLVSAASFRRPTRRWNTLREKLVREEQVRYLPDFPSPESSLANSSVSGDEIVDVEVGLASDDEREAAETISLGERGRDGNSVLWDGLENWVEQCNRDLEFWGAGSGAIFTIYQDFDGNIDRVVVNKEEIIKRNQARAWSPVRNEDVKEEFMDVSVKISRANLMAEEIESGKYKLPKNSSVAKFVVEGKKTSLVSRIHSISLKTKPFLKLFPQIGLVVLCGSCVFWAATKLFVRDEKVKLTKEEAEMLRRKKKSRMEREELEKGSVKVILDPPELPLEPGRRPQLDRKLLMESIMQDKPLRENLAITDLSNKYCGNDPYFDAKVREIREMARRARESEQQIRSQVDYQGEGDDVSSMLSASRGQEVQPEAVSTNKQLNHNNIIDVNALADNQEYAKSSGDVEKRVMSVEDRMEVINSTKEDPLKNYGVCRDYGLENAHDHITDTAGYSREPLRGVVTENNPYTSNSKIPNSGVSRNEEKIGEKKIESIILQEAKFNENSGAALNNVSKRTKPKVIMSVKEAKEYLTKKCGMPKEAQPDKNGPGERSPPHHETCNSSLDGKADNTINQTRDESTRAAEPSKPKKLQPLKHASAGSEPYRDKYSTSMLKRPHCDNAFGTKLHQDFTTNDKFLTSNEDIKVSGAKYADSQYDMPGEKSAKPLSANGVRRPSTLIDLEKDKPSWTNTVLRGDGEDIDSLTNSRSLKVRILEAEQKATVDQTGRDSGAFHTPENILALESKHASSDDYIVKGSSAGETSGIVNSSEKSTLEKWGTYGDFSSSSPVRAGMSEDLVSSTLNTALGNSEDEDNVKDLSTLGRDHLENSDAIKCDTKAKPLIAEKSWVEKNFQEFDPVIKKIGAGFKDNYMLAKEKVQEMSSLSSEEISALGFMNEDEEFEWMSDENLREIVLKVRENELAGQDPFHLMDADDKHAFFQGLERKAEKVNEQLLDLHEWIHSRIENLDYGADGISLDDPPDKIIPRWKDPVIDKGPELLKKFMENQEVHLGGDMSVSCAKEDLGNSPQIPEELLSSSGVSSSPVTDQKKISSRGASRSPKTLIECSDGSSRAGKKTGKEQWQHTKKWSQGFLEVYNAQTDPEIKSIMKDMGKDLDRWMTEKEVQKAADLLNRIPKRKRKYIEKNMDKLKREMKLYGPQAVVSKYKEYSDEQEEDYLWWLDLRYVLCIELYTIEDGNQKVGFYSLEMAADLELDPKQYHVIAFEDPGDAKNFCYIVQAHLEMLGRGSAFVVARPPKDAFREAKANGFQVTVIRMGQLKLNIDQTLEEVDEEIVEIGSKMYHDKIMRERSVDMSALIKGVFSANKSTKRRSKQMLTKPAKS